MGQEELATLGEVVARFADEILQPAGSSCQEHLCSSKGPAQSLFREPATLSEMLAKLRLTSFSSCGPLTAIEGAVEEQY